MSFPARKNCSRCTRWRPCTDFRANGWLSDGSQPLYLTSWCATCLNRRHRTEHGRELRRQSYRRTRPRRLPEMLQAGPFSAWLRQRIAQARTERDTGDARYDWLAQLVDGWGVSYYLIESVARGKQKTVRFSVVDKVLTREGIQVWELYPSYLDKDFEH